MLCIIWALVMTQKWKNSAWWGNLSIQWRWRKQEEGRDVRTHLLPRWHWAEKEDFGTLSLSHSSPLPDRETTFLTMQAHELPDCRVTEKKFRWFWFWYWLVFAFPCADKCESTNHSQEEMKHTVEWKDAPLPWSWRRKWTDRARGVRDTMATREDFCEGTERGFYMMQWKLPNMTNLYKNWDIYDYDATMYDEAGNMSFVVVG